MIQRAFTLVEAIVVFVIVATLAVLTTTVAFRILRSAKVGTCASNLSQLHKSLTMYSSDWDGWDPPFSIVAEAGKKEQATEFKAALVRYGMANESFYCPLDSDAKKQEMGEWSSHLHTSYIVGSMVPFIMQKSPGNGGTFRQSLVDRPAEFIYFMDQTKLISDKETRKRVSNHGAETNVLFLDGHLKHIAVPQH